MQLALSFPLLPWIYLHEWITDETVFMSWYHVENLSVIINKKTSQKMMSHILNFVSYNVTWLKGKKNYNP